MRADGTPDDVTLTRPLLGAILPGGATVGHPGHLPHLGRALYSLDPQARTEPADVTKVSHEVRNGLIEQFALRSGEFGEVPMKPGQGIVL